MRFHLRSGYKNLLIALIIVGVLVIPSILAEITSSNQGSPDINLTKIDFPDTVDASNLLHYNITINITVAPLNISNVSNLTLIETYPDEVIFQSSEPTALAGTNNTFILGNFSGNASIQVNITVLVNNITNGTIINNTANITYQNDSRDALEADLTFNLSISETTTVLAAVFNFTNLSINKSETADPVDFGTQFNYTIFVNVSGNGTAFNVTVNETYPLEVVFDSSQPAPLTGTNNTFILGNLTVGTNFTINITVNVTANATLPNGTIITNIINVTFQNETSDTLQIDDIETTAILNPVFNFTNISINKSVTVPNDAGKQFNYTIFVNVSGTGTAFNVTVNETYPPEVLFDSSQPAPLTGTNNTFILGNLTPGTNFTINITVNVTRDIVNGTVIVNNITVTFQNETSFTLEINDTENTTILAPVFNVSNLTINKTGFPEPVNEGEVLTYSINITSSGNGTAYNVTVTETYPSELIFFNASPTPLPGTNTTFVVGNLSVGANFTINITLNVTTGFVTNPTITNSIVAAFQNETSDNLSLTVTRNTQILAAPGQGASGGSVGGGGGGGGGVRRNTRNMDSDTQVFALRRNDQVKFSINNAEHKLTLVSILPYQLHQAVVQIGGEQIVRLISQAPKQVDTDGDGVNDVRLTLLSFSTYEVLLRMELTSDCFESWSCGGWTECANGLQTRECEDLRACGTTALKPYTSQTCNGESVPIIETDDVVAKPLSEAPIEKPLAIITEPPKFSQRIRSIMRAKTLFYGLAILALIILGWHWYSQRGKKQKHK